MISPVKFITANLALFAGLASAVPRFIAPPITQDLEPVNSTLVTRACTYTGPKAHIMAAGDTIAVGWPLAGKDPDWWGYRKELVNMMGTQNPISFVGTEHHGSGHNLQSFQGYFEKGIAEIQPGVLAALPTVNPDAIIITAGTMDVWYHYLDTPGLMDAFLTQIFNWNKDVIVILSGIPLMNSPSYIKRAEMVSVSYNDLAIKYAKEGRRILFANVQGVLKPQDLFGPAAPNTQGYKKLASVYAKSLQKAICNGWFNK